jgi:hypothetical protein
LLYPESQELKEVEQRRTGELNRLSASKWAEILRGQRVAFLGSGFLLLLPT